MFKILIGIAIGIYIYHLYLNSGSSIEGMIASVKSGHPLGSQPVNTAVSIGSGAANTAPKS